MRYGIVLYDGVEPIDLATFGVLSMARRVLPEIAVTTLARTAGPVRLANGLVVQAEHALDAAPALDVVVVTGGPGWEACSRDALILDGLRRLPQQVCIASVCTGAMIVAAAGLLDGRSATTKVEVIGAEIAPIELLAARHPAVRTTTARIVDHGRFVTGGGVTLCIDVMLHLIERFHGMQVAAETARILEYGAARDANAARLPTVIATADPLSTPPPTPSPSSGSMA